MQRSATSSRGRTGGYRLLVVKSGRLASSCKSLYSNVLGIAVDQGRIGSVDDLVVDYYPELMEVPAEAGPKPGRYVLPKDRDITFRQLISNTSGYMKPDEQPGRVFHYQTYGMNVLTHAIAKACGLYDAADPEGSPGFKVLVEEHLAAPIGIHPDYTLTNFDLQPSARLEIFGYYCGVWVDAHEAARLGWLWCNGGSWQNKQVVPARWMQESVKVAAAIRANTPRENWRYGSGFWSNEENVLWPGLPRSGFSACGAGGHHISVFPEDELVIVQLPGPTHRTADGDVVKANPELLSRVLDALNGRHT